MLRKRLKLTIAALVATSLCMSSVVPVQAQPATGSVEIPIAFGTHRQHFSSLPNHRGEHPYAVIAAESGTGSLELYLPEGCAGELSWADMPDFNLTLIDEAGVEHKTINAKDLTPLDRDKFSALKYNLDPTIKVCRAVATFNDVPEGTYSLKTQYDSKDYALFFGSKMLDGAADGTVDTYEAFEARQDVEKPIEVRAGQKLKATRLAFALVHRPLALKYKTEIGTFELRGEFFKEAEVYSPRDGEATQWFVPARNEHSKRSTYIGIGVPYGTVPAGPISRVFHEPGFEKYNIGKYPKLPQLNAEEKKKYVGYNFLGWAAYKWDETEFTEENQLVSRNGKKILYSEIETGGEFAAYEDTLFVAKWEKPTRTISFRNPVDKGSINGKDIFDYTFEGNDSLKDLNKELPKPVANSGYEFVGWSLFPGGSILSDNEILEKWNTSDAQYYAEYRPVQTLPTVKNYTFDFDPGAGKIVKGEQSYQVQENSRVDDVPQVEAPEGQEFVGWKRVSDDTLYTNIAELVWRNKATSDRSFIAVFKTIEQPAKECKPVLSSKGSWLVPLLPIIGGVVATVIPVVNKFLAGIVDSIKPQVLKDFEAWLAQRTGSSVPEEAQAAGAVITVSTVLGVLSWWLFPKQEDKC